MHITLDNKKKLQVEEKNRGIILLAGLVISFSLVRTAFLMHAFGLAYTHYMHWIFAAFLAGVAGKGYTEEACFTFNIQKKEMVWARKKPLKELQKGRLPFSEIEDVRIGYQGTGRRAKYRIELVVKGEPFPLSNIYFQGGRAKDNCDGIAQRIIETIDNDSGKKA